MTASYRLSHSRKRKLIPGKKSASREKSTSRKKQCENGKEMQEGGKEMQEDGKEMIISRTYVQGTL